MISKAIDPSSVETQVPDTDMIMASPMKPLKAEDRRQASKDTSGH